MDKSEEIRILQQKAAEARPVILHGLRRGIETYLVAHDISARFELEERLAYQWVVVTEEQFDKSRRRIAAAGIAVLVAGFALTIAGVILDVVPTTLFARPLLLGLGSGIPTAAGGLLLALASRKLAR